MDKNFQLFDRNIKYIKGVGEKRAELLNKLGVFDVYDMLHFYPRTYIDYTKSKKIIDVADGENCIVVATVISEVEGSPIRNNFTLFKCLVSDNTEVMRLAVFNNKYLAKRITPGKKYFFSGKVRIDFDVIEMSVTAAEPYNDDKLFNPVYQQTKNLTTNQIKHIVQNCLILLKQQNFPDLIPDVIKRKYKLCHELFALNAIHFPTSKADLNTASNRLVFQELFLLQCGMLATKAEKAVGEAKIINAHCIKEFSETLPYELTGAQKRVINECARDLKSGRPMNRLVQGDVGSGKTIVAASLMFATAKAGFQSALMAPTEILASQHFESLKHLLPDDICIELLTGSTSSKKKADIKSRLFAGEIDIIIGTHAVITDDVQFYDLALAVIDEQHRFGVNQRSALGAKGFNPHLLVMSATPIPRTLSLIIYGELDISLIDEMPKGRQKIETYYVNPSYESRIYSFLQKQIDNGRQAYIVCPLIEENEESDLTSAIEYYQFLQESLFATYKVGLLHGKMKSKEKDDVMKRFSNGEINILVSTTVVEVGVDVPNATVMLIRDAERFGLSQLHQLRGRVGRGKEQSYCVLMSSNMSESVQRRLGFMCKTDNGFEIADEDLKIRGPGDFLGNRQSGLPSLKIASFANDLDILKQAANAARDVFANDPLLQKKEHDALRYAVEKMFKKNNSTVFN